ncbi:MAG TPA: 2TM domain-containing protein [Flavobacteriaceae bacterium]|nr:2TM domain-containing protein [Flavobacteriaceae bacterium]
MEPDHEQKYRRARERVKELKKFYNNLGSYIIVIAFLAGVNYYTDGWNYPWFLWAAFGWGIGIAFHAVKAFEINPMFDKNWEERKIKEFMEKDEYGEQKEEKQRWE